MCDLEESATQNQKRVNCSFLVVSLSRISSPPSIFGTASIPDLFHLFSEIQAIAHILNSAVAEQRMLYIRNRPALNLTIFVHHSSALQLSLVQKGKQEAFIIYILAISSHEKRLPVY